MSRRRNKDLELIGLAGPLAGLAVIGTIFLPQVRQVVVGLGVLSLCGVGLLIGIFVVLVIYRRFRRDPVERNIDLVTRRLMAVVADHRPSSTAHRFAAVIPASELPTTAALIIQLRSIDWYQFEKLVAFAYRKSGYSVTLRGGANPDGGIDLILEKAGARTAVQCKHWKTWSVGVKAVREFLGALKDSEIEKGIFITLQGYTSEAKSLAEKHRIEIIDETGLAKMLEGTNARFDPETLAILHDEQKYCPKCESEMVQRTTRKGANIGQKFWGCSQYPRCRFILPV